MNKYIHDETIRAWLDGKVVQVQDPEGRWLPLAPASNEMIVTPAFVADCRYRIKPEDPFEALAKTIGCGCSLMSSCEIPKVPVLTDLLPLEKSDVQLVQDVVAGIEAHKLLDNQRGL